MTSRLIIEKKIRLIDSWMTPISNWKLLDICVIVSIMSVLSLIIQMSIRLLNITWFRLF